MVRVRRGKGGPEEGKRKDRNAEEPNGDVKTELRDEENTEMFEHFLLFTLSCQNFEVESGELGNEREKGVESKREREREWKRQETKQPVILMWK